MKSKEVKNRKTTDTVKTEKELKVLAFADASTQPIPDFRSIV